MREVNDMPDASRDKPVALVTGATKGIGHAVTGLLLRRGFRVVGVYGHDEAAAEAVRSEFEGLGGDLSLVRADMSGLDAVGVVERALDDMGGCLEVVVSNVGITDRVSFAETTPECWDRVLRANLSVPFFLVQRLAPRIPDNRGRIIFIGSIMGIRPHPISYSYAVSKAGLHFLAQCLVKEFSPRGVTVNVIAPGFVETPMQSGKTPAHRGRIEGRIAMGRFAEAGEVAETVVGLLDLGYVTGQVLMVDGGYDCA